jgi:hypothetical protein
MQHEMFRQQVMRDQEREIRQRIRDRRAAQRRRPSPSVRRAVGRSIIEIGHRIAAEPRQPRLARSR